ncbi:hypothetical protein ACFQ1R_12305 [Mariniflexile jejuense]|uniref:DUF3899 domain-containing protein n=1 Tax=Mariniflexile jejuense TaxID=1173582 RepID=A0ABW3JKB0_9FLAO
MITDTKTEKIITIYFYLILIIGIIWTFFGSDELDNYGPVFFMIFGFPVFAVIYQKQFYSFSNMLKQERPDIFEKNVLNYSVLKGDVISGWSVFNNKKEFKEIEPLKLNRKYKLTMKAFNFCLLSFFLSILISIVLIYK